jgi:hypothetical protein
LRVVPASVQDRDTPALIEPELAAGSLRKVWADLAFAGERAAAPLERHGVALELVGRKDKAGFAAEPRRWKVIACTELPNRGSSGPRRSSEGGWARWAMTTAVRG